MAKHKSKFYYVFRSAISGLFVSAAYAAKHVSTTVRERRRR
jgi:hypothetical protein